MSTTRVQSNPSLGHFQLPSLAAACPSCARRPCSCALAGGTVGGLPVGGLQSGCAGGVVGRLLRHAARQLRRRGDAARRALRHGERSLGLRRSERAGQDAPSCCEAGAWRAAAHAARTLSAGSSRQVAEAAGVRFKLPDEHGNGAAGAARRSQPRFAVLLASAGLGLTRASRAGAQSGWPACRCAHRLWRGAA